MKKKEMALKYYYDNREKILEKSKNKRKGL
jgi:hypothetical protein